ncbi:MAG: DUF167 domain-containing protein [bacterium]|nr:DUF167 domain-containing protein [bacterium]
MYIKVRVYPGAKKERFKKNKEDSFEVDVREKAEMNMANKRVVALLAENLNFPINKIRLVSGHHSPSKIFNIMNS